MRCSYLGQDRSDIQVAVKNLSRKMKNPNIDDMTQLKRVGRYLIARPRAALRFYPQREPKVVTAFVDSDHAGCVLTRRSTSGLVVRYGDHTIRTASSVQSTISLSSGESEYYAAVKGAAFLLSVLALMEDWNMKPKGMLKSKMDPKGVLMSDSSAARSYASRKGLGRQRPVQTRFLWLQERICGQDLAIKKVDTKDNLADVLTKSLTTAEQDKHLWSIGLVFPAGKSRKQKKMIGG